MHRLGNSKYWPFPISTWEVVRIRFHEKPRWSKNLREVARRVEFRSIFHAPSRIFKILAIPDVLARGKSYEHGFMKKRDGHKLCAKSHAESSFNRFFVHCLGNSKYWPFPIVEFRSIFRPPSQIFKIRAIPILLAHGKRTSTVS
ncbi:hypothetical protein BHE74_00057219 [Ensete ventricosum]|nr:hypothetical protein BHE74_00057219 [Ensete ventricosum]